MGYVIIILSIIFQTAAYASGIFLKIPWWIQTNPIKRGVSLTERLNYIVRHWKNVASRTPSTASPCIPSPPFSSTSFCRIGWHWGDVLRSRNPFRWPSFPSFSVAGGPHIRCGCTSVHQKFLWCKGFVDVCKLCIATDWNGYSVDVPRRNLVTNWLLS